MTIYSRLTVGLVIGYFSTIYGGYSLAQITPDGTTNTVVNTNGNNFNINRGDRAGNNLFHSFSNFSLPDGKTASFNNAADIVNIFSRVTGGNISDLNGLIRANGAANLFLINPAGIIFGKNASLDLSGSFYASSADSIVFADNLEFSAQDTSTPPLLTINAPIGLNLGNNPGDIVNRSNFGLVSTVINEDINSAFAGAEFTILNSVGLAVDSNQTIALIGGDVVLENAGGITAPGGRVQLGGLSQRGRITIKEDGNFSFPLGIARGDVILTDQARVNVAAGGGGLINVNARNLELFNQSELYAGIAEDMGFTEAQAGNITVNTTESIKIIGSGGVGEDRSNPANAFALIFNDYDTAIRNVVGFRPNQEDLDLPNLGRNPKPESTALGNAGSINLATDSLKISDRGSLTAKVYGQGDTGDISIQANNIVISEGDILNQVISGAGNTGNIDIVTNDLVLLGSPNDVDGDSSYILADTRSLGNSGNINITAFNKIEIDRVSLIQTQILAEGGEGDAGDIKINAGTFDAEGGVIQVDNEGVGDTGNITINVEGDINFDTITLNSRLANAGIEGGGNIAINAANLNLTEDSSIQRISQILADTQGLGNAGNISITVDDTINIKNTSIKAQADEDAQGNAGNINIKSKSLFIDDNSELNTQTLGQGNAGSITVDSIANVSLESSLVQVDSQGNENAGNININTRSLELDNQGTISAITASGDGGNIELSIGDRILLDNSSFISTQALENGDGGNIDIDSNFIIAFPKGNSDIVANAVSGNGGQVEINTQGLFGIESREELTGENDINASSQFGLDGVVEINTLDIDPTQGLTELPTAFIVAQPLQGCQASREPDNSSFVNIGRGGLPSNPYESLDNSSVFDDVQLPNGWQNKSVASSSAALQNQESITEANAWVVNQQGNIELVVNTSNNIMLCGDRFSNRQ